MVICNCWQAQTVTNRFSVCSQIVSIFISKPIFQPCRYYYFNFYLSSLERTGNLFGGILCTWVRFLSIVCSFSYLNAVYVSDVWKGGNIFQLQHTFSTYPNTYNIFIIIKCFVKRRSNEAIKYWAMQKIITQH